MANTMTHPWGMRGTMVPGRIRIYEEPAPDGAAGGAAGAGDGTAAGAGDPQGAGTAGTANFDYDKLASIITGKQSAAEDTVLKSYFKQQGLSQEEMNQAIAAFKQQKAASQPDPAALQTQVKDGQAQLAQAQAALIQERVNNAAAMTAMTLGLDAKTIPYVLKMADLSQAMGQDGKISEEAIKTAITKVLEDVPALKPQTQASGFKVGAPAGSQQTTNEDALKKAFGL